MVMVKLTFIFLSISFVGCTDDLHIVVKDVMCRFPKRKLIGLGFSMGANVLLKYLGEQPNRQSNFTFALSICQGYDCVRWVTHCHYYVPCSYGISKRNIIFVYMEIYFTVQQIKILYIVYLGEYLSLYAPQGHFI